jgi:molybdate transport system regulatory protein
MTAASSPEPLHASITLRKAEAGRVGAERIALLREIRDSGSISAAARAVGLSYKGAWDAVQVLNNLFEQPLVVPSAGGKEGGASLVTAAGDTVIEAFGIVEAELGAAMARLEARLSAAQGAALTPILWGIAMKTSARNALAGTVVRVLPGPVNSEVGLNIAEGVEITAGSVEHLGLAPGSAAIALIKSSFVILARGDATLRTSARNTLAGTVIAREDGPVGSEITLELQVGKTLTATLTRESADALDLTIGTPAFALVKASNVILAVD